MIRGRKGRKKRKGNLEGIKRVISDVLLFEKSHLMIFLSSDVIVFPFTTIYNTQKREEEKVRKRNKKKTTRKSCKPVGHLLCSLSQLSMQ